MPRSPRCQIDQPIPFEDVGTSLDWFRCPKCGHLWAENARPAAPSERNIAPSDATHKHILVVDDDPNVLQLIGRLLGADYQVSLARDGDEALAILRTGPIDLLIVDYLMPTMTGQELVARSRAEGVTCPVLVITGHGRIVQQAEGAWWMNHPHLLKPFQYDELRDIVAKLLKEPKT